MGKEMPLVSIITVNYNGKRFLEACFESLSNLNYPKDKIEIFMVDNGSNDDSIDYVKNCFPNVKIILNSENNYAKANNLGIKASKGEYVALINNDTKVDKNWLIELVEAIRSDDSIGAVGSKILFMDGAIQSVGHQEYPDYYWGDIGFRDEDKGQYDFVKEVISICGCSILYRRECLNDVGLLDEDFNMYMEDVDMAIRCKNKKWELLICPGSVIRHEYHGTIKSDNNSFFWVEANRLLLIAKHWPEKLAGVLSGRGYFTIKDGGFDNARDISQVIGNVYSKLLKEHGYETLKKMSADLFEAIRRIYNFEKNYLIQSAMNEREEKNNLIEEVGMLRAENLKLGQVLLLLKQEKAQQIESLIKQNAQEKELIKKEAEARLLLLLQENAQEMAALKQQKELELNKNKILLQSTMAELKNIKSSTGYRFILLPLWGLLWRIKTNIKRTVNTIKNKVNNKPIIIENLRKLFAKIKDVYWYSLTNEKQAGVYMNHIKHMTYPVTPEKLTLMITRRCNLKCRFCDISELKRENDILPKEGALKIIDAAQKLGIKDLVLTGGEPFLHPDIFGIIDFVNSRNINLTITTNGLFVKRYINKILTSRINCVSVSIDGKEPTHDFLRNCPGAYKEAMEAIDILKNHKINVSVNFVVTNKNVYELEDTYQKFSTMGIKVTFLPVINKPELFISNVKEKEAYLKFIKKLLNKRSISTYDYKYLKFSIDSQFSGKSMNMRCLGLNLEFAIDTNGDISACCVWENKEAYLNNLGNALKSNIEDLWFSPYFSEVRQAIFKQGCRDCFNPSIIDLPKKTGVNFIIPQKKRSNNIIKLKESGKMIDKPKHVHMRLTSRCNLSCRHCDIWQKKNNTEEEISLAEWKECIDKLYSWLGAFKLDLAGGEILLYRDAIPIIQYCASKGIAVNLTTNGALIDELMAEKIVNSGLYCINLSLDGLEDVHCYTRNNPSIFLNVQQAAERLLKYRKQEIPYISLTTVITKYNLKQLSEIVNLTQKWNINNISFQALDQNFGAKYDVAWFKVNKFWPDKLSEAGEAIDNLKSMKKKGIRIDNSIEQLNAFKRYYKDPGKEINNKCFSGGKNFIINEFGDVFLCWNMPSVGSLLKGKPEEIWNNESAITRREQIETCNRTCRILNCNYVEY